MGETAVHQVCQLPSASLRSHRSVSLLWLPLSLCLENALEDSRNALENNNSDTGVGERISGRNVGHIVSQMSGFEQRLLCAVLKNSLVPMSSLRGVFPAASEYYKENAVLEISVRVATDASAFIASPWAEMEAHKSTAAVVVVLNCHDYEPRQAIAAVKVIFQHYFKEITCRCIVLDPTVEAQAGMLQHVFIPTYTNLAVDDVTQCLLKEISLSVVQHVNACIVAPEPSLDTIKSTAASASEKHSHISAVSGGSDAYKKGVLHSRWAKRRGDFLLQLGAMDAALIAYHDSLPSADALWCSATLESLAALRYLQRGLLFSLSKKAENIFSSIESDETIWNDDMKKTLLQLETAVEKVKTDQSNAALRVRHSILTLSLSRRLVKEVEEPLLTHCENLRRHLTSIRRSLSVRNKETEETRVGETCRNARCALKEFLHITFLEVRLYLQEALQQLRFASGLQMDLWEREVLILLKCTELLAEEGDKQGFLESLGSLKAAANNAQLSVQRDIRERIPYLCSLCGCWRKAIYYVVEAAMVEQRANAHSVSISLLMRACRMAGIPLPDIELQGQTMNWSVITQHNGLDCVTMKKGNSSTGSVGHRLHRAQDVPLLMKLLDAVIKAGLDNGVQGAVASLLLFEYYSVLSRETQQSLMGILERAATPIETFLSTPPLLLHSMKALPLPPDLAPKTVPLSGAQFTFIDTGRLKMTMLTLNGKILPPEQVIWSVGDVGEVKLVLTNPFRHDLQLTSIALSCRAVSTLDEVERDDDDDDVSGHIMGSFAPSTYVVTGVILPSLSKRHFSLQVQPNMEGYVVVDGVEIRLGQLPLCSTFFVPSPTPTIIPVLQRLPVVSCVLGVNEVEIFGGQKTRFSLHLINPGFLAIQRLHLTVHDESCQLDACNGCKERVSTTSIYVVLEQGRLNQTDSFRLDPGGALMMYVTMVAPDGNEHVVFQHIVFRVTIELPYDPPAAPENVPSAVPVFAVIPRRVQETFLRVFHVPSVTVTSLELSRDGRHLEITVKNKSKLHTIEILCSHMFFTNIPDALIVPGAGYLIPPIEITKIPPGMRHFLLPWVVRELPDCRGELSLDLSILENVAVCTDPLEDAVVCIKALRDGVDGAALEWRSGATMSGEIPFKVPVMKPVQLFVTVRAPWKRAVSLRVRLSMENHLDADVLSGPVDTVCIVGGGTTSSNGGGNSEGENGHDGSKGYEESFEYFAFKTGKHVLAITLSDLEGREMTHFLCLHVEHL